MKDIRERVAAVEQVAHSAHKRIDDTTEEMSKQRKATHDLSGIVHGHTGILSMLPTSVDNLAKAVERNSLMTSRMMWAFYGACTAGFTIISSGFYILNMVLNYIKIK